MKRIDVQAYGDPSRPDQGLAIVLLRGQRGLPAVPVFRIRPVDPLEADDIAGQWPEGDQIPVASRLTDEGTELVLGPEVAECPGLLPGTAVEIEVPEARICGEFLWPSIAPIARPKRRSLLGKRNPREPRADLILDIETTVRPAFQTREPEPTMETSAVMEAPRVAPAVRPAPSALLAASTNASPGTTRPPIRTEGGPHMTALTHAPLAARDVEADGVPSAAGDAAASADPAYVAWYPHARGGRLGPPGAVPASPRLGAASLLPTSRLGIAGLVVVSVVAIEGLLFALKGTPVASSPDQIASRPAEISAAQPAADIRLYEALHVAEKSPRGTASKETNPEKLLEQASGFLHASGSARDVEEGAHWLKRYLGVAVGDERTLRALTQLGSVYAEPAGRTPDYPKARQLWEIAGAFGDPVALCFLGALAEHGLGVQQDRKQALQWYQRAKLAGGCPSNDEAINRVKQ